MSHRKACLQSFSLQHSWLTSVQYNKIPYTKIMISSQFRNFAIQNMNKLQNEFFLWIWFEREIERQTYDSFFFFSLRSYTIYFFPIYFTSSDFILSNFTVFLLVSPCLVKTTALVCIDQKLENHMEKHSHEFLIRETVKFVSLIFYWVNFNSRYIFI